MMVLKMIEIMEKSSASGRQPAAWRIRNNLLGKLKWQCRHTGDLCNEGGQLKFLGVPVEVADVRNSLGAELVI